MIWISNFFENIAERVQRENSYYAIPSGNSAISSSEASNFTFIPPLIHHRLYEMTVGNVLHWWRKDSLTNYLLEILPLKALGDGFHLVDPDEEEAKPVSDWKLWSRQLRKKCPMHLGIKAQSSSRGFGLAGLNYTDSKKFQVLHGHKITQVEADDFGEITKINVGAGTANELNLDNLRLIRRDFPDDPKGYSYLEPIWDKLVFILWITFSMCEAAAAEGAKFLTIGLSNPKKGAIARLAATVPGVSSRKAFIHDVKAITSDDIKVHSTLLNATFSTYLDACYRQVSLYTCMPEALLTGVHAGALTGAQTDIGSEYEAFGLIQREAEPLWRDIMSNPPFNFEVEELKFVWHKIARMTELQKAQLEVLKAQANQVKLSWMLPDEVRDVYKLKPLPEGNGKFLSKLILSLSGKNARNNPIPAGATA